MQRLCEPGPLGPDGARLVETHISYVLLTGSYAYKIKKAVELPFLDFSTLAARHRYCNDELRLNRRFAPDLYRDVVPITMSSAGPSVDGHGTVVEYAVRMREFAQDALLSSVLARGALTPRLVDGLAARVATLHGAAPAAAPDSAYGHPGRVLQMALDNFASIAPDASGEEASLAALERWTRSEHAVRLGAFTNRHESGAIRECHGDLHLANFALVDGQPTLFDCIEFSDELRWIDPMSEIAFTAMDLEHGGRADLAHRFVSAYLESSGDYVGCSVLRFYLVYRAMVRAKTACVRAAQLPPGEARAAARRDLGQYVALANRYAGDTLRSLVVMHGPSGSGKSTLAELLVGSANAIRIRTDVERKRLAGLASLTRSGSALDAGLYAAHVTRATYEHVLHGARSVLDGGFVALADGAFLERWQRDLARECAADHDAALVIVDCQAAAEVLQARVAARAAEARDASEATVGVLEHQLGSYRPIEPDELRYVVSCRTDGSSEAARSPDAWRDLIERIRRRAPPPRRSVTASSTDASLAAKLAFLSRPETYEGVMSVEPVETHMSWVFLAGGHAYKLKKPVRNPYVDFRTVDSRARNCFEELRVNRRFAADVYLGTVSLRRDARGALCLDGDGETVDWLVRMRRLPAERMLDRVITAGRFDARCLDPVIRLLVRVYHRSGAVTLKEHDYRRRLIDAIAQHERDLLRAEAGLPARLVRNIVDRQHAFAQHTPHLLDRVRDRRIVEGHGDLRPEHVCVEPEPRIIDSLEFSRELRLVDAADELGFLALECERLGAPEARATIFGAYGRYSGDTPPPALVDFYQSMRACVRAMLAVRHLGDDTVRDDEHWRAQARSYLELAMLHVTACVPAHG